MDPTPGSLADQHDEADPERVAALIVLRALSQAPRTRHQLAELLRRRRVDAEVAERVLDRYEAVGYIDDTAFAVEWVRQRHRDKGLARRALAGELTRRGIAPEDQVVALGGIAEHDEIERATALALRRAEQLRGLPLSVATRRLAGYLARRGYSSATISSVVRRTMTDVDGQESA